MYESHFGLTRRPFLSTPDPDCFASGESIDNALAGLTLCVESGKGFGILSAPAGTGKTLLCRKLVNDLSDRFAAVFLANSHFPTRRSLLQAILYELGHPYMRMAEQELRLELQTAARNVRPEKQAVLLVIDEAHLLGEHLLEEIRTAGNLDLDGTPLFHVILSGQLELEENLICPGLEAFNQRIGCQVTLESLTREESALYIAHRLQWAGADISDVLQPEAVQVICHAADGSPRCLNQLCDHSLLLSYVSDEQPVSEATVREALEDLKQLPLHWNEPTPIGSPLQQLHAEVDRRAADDYGVDVQPPVEDLEPDALFEEFPSDESRVVNSAALTECDDSVEHGDSASVEFGAPLPSVSDEATIEESVCEVPVSEEPVCTESVCTESVCTESVCTEPVCTEPVAAIFEIGASDVTEYAESEASEAEAGPSLLHVEEQLNDDLADAPLISFHRQSIADDGRGFEEELVVDRYAMLDAGLTAAEQLALSSLGVRSDIAHAQPATGDIEKTEDQQPAELEATAESQAGVLEIGQDADTTQTPVELLDAIEPLISEVLNDPTAEEDETAGRMTETVVSTSLPQDDEDWAGLTTGENDATVSWVGGDMPPAVVDVAEYDIVQPEVAQAEVVEPDLASSEATDADTDAAAQGKKQGRYAHLFSKLRRQQRRSA